MYIIYSWQETNELFHFTFILYVFLYKSYTLHSNSKLLWFTLQVMRSKKKGKLNKKTKNNINRGNNNFNACNNMYDDGRLMERNMYALKATAKEI